MFKTPLKIPEVALELALELYENEVLRKFSCFFLEVNAGWDGRWFGLDKG